MTKMIIIDFICFSYDLNQYFYFDSCYATIATTTIIIELNLMLNIVITNLKRLFIIIMFNVMITIMDSYQCFLYVSF